MPPDRDRRNALSATALRTFSSTKEAGKTKNLCSGTKATGEAADNASAPSDMACGRLTDGSTVKSSGGIADYPFIAADYVALDISGYDKNAPCRSSSFRFPHRERR